MSTDDAGRAIAELDQSKAGIETMAEHLCAFYTKCRGSMCEAHALDLTSTLLIELLAKDDEDE